MAKAADNPFYTKKELNNFKKSADKLEKLWRSEKIGFPVGRCRY